MKNKGISIREILIITFGMFLVAAGVYFFMIPGNIVAGSVSGLALVLSKLLGIQAFPDRSSSSKDVLRINSLPHMRTFLS